jgi:hypothetical protein
MSAIRVPHRGQANMGLASIMQNPRAAARRLRAWRPTALGCGLALGPLICAAIVLTAGVLIARAAANQSSFVQQHGLAGTATVQWVDENQVCGRASCSYAATIGAALDPPVRGADSTIIHYPGYSDLVVGQTVPVLVDPGQLGYAELPGSLYAHSVLWILLAVLAVPCDALTLLDAGALVWLLRRSRRGRTAATG